MFVCSLCFFWSGGVNVILATVVVKRSDCNRDCCTSVTVCQPPSVFCVSCCVRTKSKLWKRNSKSCERNNKSCARIRKSYGARVHEIKIISPCHLRGSIIFSTLLIGWLVWLVYWRVNLRPYAHMFLRGRGERLDLSEWFKLIFMDMDW